MSETENGVYEILSQITGLKFKVQFENSGLNFQNIYFMEDLETEERSYRILIDNKAITFRNNQEFLQKFIKLLNINMKQFDYDYKEVQKVESQLVYDENWAFEEHERIGYYGLRQRKLLEKMKIFLSGD